MHQSYAGLRRALAAAMAQGDRRAQDLLRINLQRVRFLPADGRYVLVNTAAQRLYMYEDGQVVDWMKVVVGKAASADANDGGDDQVHRAESILAGSG